MPWELQIIKSFIDAVDIDLGQAKQFYVFRFFMHSIQKLVREPWPMKAIGFNWNFFGKI